MANDEITKEKIRRAMLAGPESITSEASIVEMEADGKFSVLRQGSNGWTCMPGSEDEVGNAPMCANEMGMQWFKDIMAKKPKPTNTAPGLIYMLYGAVQRSFTDPFDRMSPAIPIGPHWMLMWPFSAKDLGMPSIMRDAGALVMFDGTPYAHLHICGSPWDGNEYHTGDRAIRTLTYEPSTVTR